MPQRPHMHEPDAVDCNTMVNALAEDFGVICDLETRYERDMVVVICRTYKLASLQEGVVQVQALVKAPLKSRRSLYTLQYSAMLDCWHQHDRGVLAVAQTPIERGWDGRPRQARRHT